MDIEYAWKEFNKIRIGCGSYSCYYLLFEAILGVSNILDKVPLFYGRIENINSFERFESEVAKMKLEVLIK